MCVGGGEGGRERERVCAHCLRQGGREERRKIPSVTISSKTASECDAVGGNSCISLGRA